MTAQELNTKLQDGEELLLLDIRQYKEKARWDLGGKHIFLSELPNRFREITKYRKKLVVVFCTGNSNDTRAKNAKYILKKAAFERVEVLEGGMKSWFKIYQDKFPI